MLQFFIGKLPGEAPDFAVAGLVGDAAVEAVGLLLVMQGQQHRALEDARNTARLLPLIFAIRVFGDFAVISPSLAILKRKRQLGWGFLAVGFIILLELVIPLSLLKKEVVWKGQVFR